MAIAYTTAAAPVHPVQKIIDEALAWGAANYGVLARNPQGSMRLLSRNARATVVALALSYVMRQRKGAQCGDLTLAYADHYLQARMMVGYLGPSGYQATQATVVGYEAVKKVFEALGILDKLASDDQCAQPVAPDLTSVAWGLKGCDDGISDHLGASADGAEGLVDAARNRLFPPQSVAR